MARYRAAVFTTLLAVCAFWTASFSGQDLPPQAESPTQMGAALRQRAEREGRVRVIVELRLPSGAHLPEGRADPAAVNAQRRAIGDAGGRVLARLQRANHRLLRRYQTVPYVALDVDAAALDSLANAGPDVVRVMEDRILRPVLAESGPLIEADQAWSSRYDGAGTTIAILDSGVDAQHPFLSGKVMEEACYSSTVAGESRTVCPNGQDEQLGPGSAPPCLLTDCYHGTHVAGIAAGDGATAGQTFSGVAKGAQIMAVQVFSEVIDAAICGGVAPCLGGYSSDVIAGLERVYAVAGQRTIAAVNMSLGEGNFSATCDTQPYKPIIDNLRSIGVATVVASGNSGYRSRLSSPACISTAVSVASTDKSDQVSYFSNVASFLSLLAPGDGIVSSVPGNGFEALSGTSMAAPHVAGSWAVLRQAVPTASVTAILNAFRQTGLPVADTRFSGTITTPRVRILRALGTFVPITNPVPAVSAVSPARVRVGSGANTLTVSGTGFNTFSVMQWNGAPRPTTVVSTTQLRGSLTAADVAAVGSGQVSVAAPAPGGGSSTSLTVPIDPPPSLTVNATTVAPGSAATVTLANGYGGQFDWLALAAGGSANTSYLQWTYVGTGVTDRTWTVAMPATPGPYEFRLFRDNGYTRAATSPVVTVDQAVNPTPTAGSLSPSRTTAGGAAFVLTVAGSNFTSASTVRWNGANRPTTFVSATQLQASIGTGDIAAPGTAQVTVFTPTPGGGTSAPLTFTVTTAPTITVSATNVPTGTSVTATLLNGMGGGGDWLALASTSSPNTGYLQYVYVGGGVVTRAWTVAMPQTPGTYEFRLFLNNTYNRAATSPPITVVSGPNPAPVLTSTTPSSAAVGGGAFTLAVNGSGFVSSSVVRWNGANRTTTFVSGTELRAAIPATDIAAAGTAQISVFSPAPGSGLSSSVPFTISGSASAISVSATAVAGGTAVTATLTNSSGGSGDWLALASSSAPNTSFVQYTYVGAGVTNRTWTVTMPTTPGNYEFRLFLNNSYTRAATSPPVTVTGQPAQLSVNTTAGSPGSPVTVTLTNGFGGSTDWIAFASTSAPDTSYVQYVYVGAGVTTRTWTVNLPATPGAYEFRLYRNDTFVRAATSPPVTSQ